MLAWGCILYVALLAVIGVVHLIAVQMMIDGVCCAVYLIGHSSAEIADCPDYCCCWYLIQCCADWDGLAEDPAAEEAVD